MSHRDIFAELEGHVSRYPWVHEDDMTEERVSAVLTGAADMGEAGAASDLDVLDSMEPAHAKDTSLASHMERVGVVEVCFGQGPCLGCVK